MAGSAPPRGVLGTGATGFLGQYVLRELVAKDWKVCGLGGAEERMRGLRTRPDPDQPTPSRPHSPSPSSPPPPPPPPPPWASPWPWATW